MIMKRLLMMPHYTNLHSASICIHCMYSKHKVRELYMWLRDHLFSISYWFILNKNAQVKTYPKSREVSTGWDNKYVMKVARLKTNLKSSAWCEMVFSNPRIIAVVSVSGRRSHIRWFYFYVSLIQNTGLIYIEEKCGRGDPQKNSPDI